MFNDEYLYFQCGKRCGRARRNKDESTAQFEKNWFNSAIYYENEPDKKIARNEFADGYKMGRGSTLL